MEEYLQEFKEVARKLHSEGKLVMFSHNPNYVAYKVADDEKIHVRYICPKCKYQEEIYDILKFPPKLKCKECKFLVWESKLRKSRGRKAKKDKPVTL